jgi:hypothetical protein
MARSVALVAFGVIVGVVGGAALGLHAANEGGGGDVAEAATETLEEVASVAPAPAAPSRLDRLVECVIWRESRGNPNAVNPRSGASGLGQFLRGTWLSTPQGRAGYSVFDPSANRAAVRWMIEVGRGREFVTIGGC